MLQEATELKIQTIDVFVQMDTMTQELKFVEYVIIVVQPVSMIKVVAHVI